MPAGSPDNPDVAKAPERQPPGQPDASPDAQAIELRLQRFLDALPIGVFVIDTAGRLYYANATAQRILGQRGPDETDPTRLPEVYQAYRAGSSQLYPGEEQPIVRALSGESSTVSDMEIQHPDRRIPIEVWASPIRDASGHITHAIAGFYDITERKRVEEETARHPVLEAMFTPMQH